MSTPCRERRANPASPSGTPCLHVPWHGSPRLSSAFGDRVRARSALDAYDELARRGVQLTFGESRHVVRLLYESAEYAELQSVQTLVERVPVADAEEFASRRALSRSIAKGAAELELLEELRRTSGDCSEYF